MMSPKSSFLSQLEASLQPLQHLYALQYFKHIDSTNQEAMRQLEGGVQSGTVIVAEQQSAGRGRLGRVWHTVEDALAMSIIFRPDLPPEKISQLSLVTAVALQQTLANYCADIRIKWPNDLLIHGAKVSGILTEMRTQQKHVDGVVIGLGVNLKQPQKGWPSDIQQQVTDIQSHCMQPISRTTCAMQILTSLDHWYDIYLQQGFAAIRHTWWQYHIASNQKVRVFNGNSYIEGVATALDDDGALLLDVQGAIQRIMAGEVFLQDISGSFEI
ncbi:MAG: biotin--[acetyl-CoA-carboxylase] ligase [Mariprofundaceae bacterium]|nr:biotin--[acetyl-CoA-carboxylase] ligase [Mariprofundaceae bacterium]